MDTVLDIILLIVCASILIGNFIVYMRVRFNFIIMLLIAAAAVAGVITFVSLLIKGLNAVTSVDYTYEEFVDDYMPKYLDKNYAFVFETERVTDSGNVFYYDGEITCDNTNVYVSYRRNGYGNVRISLPRQSAIPYSYDCTCDLDYGGQGVVSGYSITNDYSKSTVINLNASVYTDEFNSIVSDLTYRALYAFLGQIKTSHLKVNSAYLGIFKNVASNFGIVRNVEISQNPLDYAYIISILQDYEDGYVFKTVERLNGREEYKVGFTEGNVILEYSETANVYDAQTGEQTGERVAVCLRIYIPITEQKPDYINGRYEDNDNGFTGAFNVVIRKTDDNVLDFTTYNNVSGGATILQQSRQTAKGCLNALMSTVNKWFIDNHNFDTETIGIF